MHPFFYTEFWKCCPFRFWSLKSLGRIFKMNKPFKQKNSTKIVHQNFSPNNFHKIIHPKFSIKIFSPKLPTYIMTNSHTLLCLVIENLWIKIAPPGGLEPPTFRLTAERASRLRHGGISQVKKHFWSGKTIFYQIEFCQYLDIFGAVIFWQK